MTEIQKGHIRISELPDVDGLADDDKMVVHRAGTGLDGKISVAWLANMISGITESVFKSELDKKVDFSVYSKKIQEIIERFVGIEDNYVRKEFLERLLNESGKLDSAIQDDFISKFTTWSSEKIKNLNSIRGINELKKLGLEYNRVIVRTLFDGENPPPSPPPEGDSDSGNFWYIRDRKDSDVLGADLVLLDNGLVAVKYAESMDKDVAESSFSEHLRLIRSLQSDKEDKGVAKGLSDALEAKLKGSSSYGNFREIEDAVIAKQDPFWTKSGDNIHNINSSKVGVGTSSPTEKFHVDEGGLLVTSTNYASIKLQRKDADLSSIVLGVVSSSGAGHILAKKDIHFYANSTTNKSSTLALTSGKLGFGTTSPSAKVHIVSNIDAIAKFGKSKEDRLTINYKNNAIIPRAVYWWTGSNMAKFKLGNYSDHLGVTIDGENGFLGIKKDNPSVELDVNGKAIIGNTLKTNNSGLLQIGQKEPNASFGISTQFNSYTLRLWVDDAGIRHIGAGSTAMFNFSTSGVGILKNPNSAYRLDVNGKTNSVELFENGVALSEKYALKTTSYTKTESDARYGKKVDNKLVFSVNDVKGKVPSYAHVKSGEHDFTGQRVLEVSNNRILVFDEVDRKFKVYSYNLNSKNELLTSSYITYNSVVPDTFRIKKHLSYAFVSHAGFVISEDNLLYHLDYGSLSSVSIENKFDGEIVGVVGEGTSLHVCIKKSDGTYNFYSWDKVSDPILLTVISDYTIKSSFIDDIHVAGTILDVYVINNDLFIVSDTAFYRYVVDGEDLKLMYFYTSSTDYVEKAGSSFWEFKTGEQGRNTYNSQLKKHRIEEVGGFLDFYAKGQDEAYLNRVDKSLVDATKVVYHDSGKVFTDSGYFFIEQSVSYNTDNYKEIELFDAGDKMTSFNTPIYTYIREGGESLETGLFITHCLHKNIGNEEWVYYGGFSRKVGIYLRKNNGKLVAKIENLEETVLDEFRMEMLDNIQRL